MCKSNNYVTDLESKTKAIFESSNLSQPVDLYVLTANFKLKFPAP